MARIIDVVEWADQGPTDIMQRVPDEGQGDIRMGSQLIVRPSQVAMFMRDGKVLDTFTEGRHTLSTNNLPLITNILKLGTDNRTPFPAEVYFVTTKEFLDMKWGTPAEITTADSVLGMVQLKAFGTYSMQIKNPQQFVTQVTGVQGLYTTDQINDYLRSILISQVAGVLGETMKTGSLLNLAALQAKLGQSVVAAAKDDFDRIGIDLKSLYVVSIQPGDETAAAIATRSAMGAVNANYMEYQAGKAMRDAAGNPSGGSAAIGAGLGAGVGIGQVMGSAIASGMQQSRPQPPAEPAAAATAAVSAAMTKAQIQDALTALDVRLAKGEISEDIYNKLQANLQKALASAAS